MFEKLSSNFNKVVVAKNFEKPAADGRQVSAKIFQQLPAFITPY